MLTSINVIVKWLAILLHVLEVTNVNLGLKTGYDKFFQTNTAVVTLVKPEPLTSISLPIHCPVLIVFDAI
jgi:hypothetical protein